MGAEGQSVGSQLGGVSLQSSQSRGLVGVGLQRSQSGAEGLVSWELDSKEVSPEQRGCQLGVGLQADSPEERVSQLGVGLQRSQSGAEGQSVSPEQRGLGVGLQSNQSGAEG